MTAGFFEHPILNSPYDVSGAVDVVNREGLKPYVRPAATADAIYAF